MAAGSIGAAESGIAAESPDRLLLVAAFVVAGSSSILVEWLRRRSRSSWWVNVPGIVAVVILVIVGWLVFRDGGEEATPLPTPTVADVPATPTPTLADQLSDRLRGVTLGTSDAVIRELAADIRVNLNTVAKAYHELDLQGVITTQRGIKNSNSICSNSRVRKTN